MTPPDFGTLFADAFPDGRRPYDYTELAPHLAERVIRLEAAVLAEKFAARPPDESLLTECHARVCGDLTPEWAGGWRASRPASRVALGPVEIPIQFFSAERAHHATLAEQLLEGQAPDPGKLSRFACRERPAGVEGDGQLLAQLNPDLLTRNAHRFRRFIGNFDHQWHTGNRGDRSAESK
jgi:hypothetical protein